MCDTNAVGKSETLAVWVVESCCKFGYLLCYHSNDQSIRVQKKQGYLAVGEVVCLNEVFSVLDLAAVAFCLQAVFFPLHSQ